MHEQIALPLNVFVMRVNLTLLIDITFEIFKCTKLFWLSYNAEIADSNVLVHIKAPDLHVCTFSHFLKKKKNTILTSTPPPQIFLFYFFYFTKLCIIFLCIYQIVYFFRQLLNCEIDKIIYKSDRHNLW